MGSPLRWTKPGLFVFLIYLLIKRDKIKVSCHVERQDNSLPALSDEDELFGRESCSGYLQAGLGADECESRRDVGLVSVYGGASDFSFGREGRSYARGKGASYTVSLDVGKSGALTEPMIVQLLKVSAQGKRWTYANCSPIGRFADAYDGAATRCTPLSVKRAEKIACAGNLRYDYGHVIFDP